MQINNNKAATLANRALEYCEELALFSQSPGIVDRRYLTREHQQANSKIADWSIEYGLKTWQDAAANQWVRLSSDNPNAKRIILGSHTDTIPNAGKYDGVLGVVAPLVLLQHFAKSGCRFAFHIDVVGFGDEEGTRFGATLLGSSALAGKWKNEWLDLCDEDKVSLQQAFENFGLQAQGLATAEIDKPSVLAYMETHIEQGPVLESLDLPLGAVSGIAGAKRFEIVLTSRAGHAGTVPMNLRSDPLVLAAQWINLVDNVAQASNGSPSPVVATVGQLSISPGAVNVIPGSVSLSLDIRSLSDLARDHALDALLNDLKAQSMNMKIGLHITETHNAESVNCCPELVSKIEKILAQLQDKAYTLASGAGHDAMVLADVVPTCMLFVRCKEGISHHPDEHVTQEDVAKAIVAISMFIHSFE